MKIKVSEATNLQIDWLVAKCEAQRGEESKGPDWLAWLVPAPSMIPHYHPSTDWAQGGPIIDRESIGLMPSRTAYYERDGGTYYSYGPTPLIAAMRCFVASKLGDEVEVPEELA